MRWVVTAGDECSYHGRPAPPEGVEISERGRERLGPGVDRAQQHLVLEHHVAHEASRICLDEGLQARDAGQHEDAIGAQDLQCLQGEVGVADRLVNQVNVADLRGQLRERRRLGGHVGRADGGDQIDPRIRRQLAGVAGRSMNQAVASVIAPSSPTGPIPSTSADSPLPRSWAGVCGSIIGRQNMAVVSHLLRDPGFTFYCLVDSKEQIDQLGAFFSARGQRLQVLLELGVMGGRTGVRNDAQLQAVLDALSRWSAAISLSGVEMYEGILEDEPSIRAFLRRAVDVTRNLAAEGRFQCAPILLSGAGSVWYDIVAEEFSSAGFGDAVQIVLRPGCYITHDIGAYRKAQSRILAANPIAQKMHSDLEPALQVWAYVQSIPEADRAIVAMGKRDAAFDSGLPTPALHFRPGEPTPRRAPEHWLLTKMMDQHAYMQIAAEDNLRVGDMIGFDISHPCLTFDKWRVLPMLDAKFQVVDVVQTFF